MAETAEQLECRGFDRHYYETARSLALAPAIGRMALQESFSGIEQRRTDEVIDGIAEAIPGLVNNIRSYDVAGGVLVAEDGQPMEDLLMNGLRHAIKQASNDNFLSSFGPTRARHELDEARLWQKMVNGETNFNTLQILSPYSEEYLTDATVEKLQQAGQEPKTKRAMLRMAHWDGRQLHVLTRSIDNSSVEILRDATEGHDGYKYSANSSTDMLGERRGLVMNKGQVFRYADGLVARADMIISQRLGEQTVQGRKISEAHDTQKYVQSQTMIINNLMKISRDLAGQHSNYDDYKTAWEKELHDYISLIKVRMLSNDTRAIVDVGRAASAAGAAAAARGESYNMCGTIIAANGQPAAGEGTGMESIKNLIGKKVTCPECKEKVIIPTGKLNDGRLCCPDCKYEVDVCTGQVYSKSQRGNRHPVGQNLGIADAIIYEFRRDMQRIDREILEKKAAENAQEAQLAKAA